MKRCLPFPALHHHNCPYCHIFMFMEKCPHKSFLAGMKCLLETAADISVCVFDFSFSSAAFGGKVPLHTYLECEWSASRRLLQTSASVFLHFLCFSGFLVECTFNHNMHIWSVYEGPLQTTEYYRHQCFAVSDTLFFWSALGKQQSFDKLSVCRWTCIFKQNQVSIADFIKDPKGVAAAERGCHLTVSI